MKYIVSAALLVGAAQAFTTPPLTFAVGKKAPAKKAKAAATKAVKKAAVVAKKVAKKAAPKPVAATKPILKAFQKAAPKVAPKVTPKVTPKAAPKKVAPKKAAPVKKVAPVKKTTPVPKQPKVVAKVSKHRSLMIMYFRRSINAASNEGQFHPRGKTCDPLRRQRFYTLAFEKV